MAAWAIWMIAGVALLILELISMSFFLLWLAVAAILTGVVAIFVHIWWVQWVVFAILSIVLLLATRPLARSIHGRVTQPSNVDALIGSRALVIETIDPLKNIGRVRIGSDEWRARAEQAIPLDAWAEVISVAGTDRSVSRNARQSMAAGAAAATRSSRLTR